MAAVARDYPVDDARNTYGVAVWQAQHCRNTVNLPAQCAAAWAAHLSAMWGIRTDASRGSDAGGARGQARRGRCLRQEQGFMREDGSRTWPVIHEAVTKTCNGSPQRTERGRGTAQEVTRESGDGALERFSEVSKTEKLLKTYLPFVQSGVEVPINVRPNILPATGRASYDGLIQLLPRRAPPGSASVPRPGMWVQRGLQRHRALHAGAGMPLDRGALAAGRGHQRWQDAHTVLVSTMTSRPYEELLPLVKLPGEVKDLRQAGKAANFGFPGGMGAAKFVIAKRKEGLRVCRVMGKEAQPCGTEMVTSWKDRETSPVCRQCVEAAEELRRFYLGTWTEMRGYFAYVTSHAETSAEGDAVSERARPWGLPLHADVQHLVPGARGGRRQEGAVGHHPRVLPGHGEPPLRQPRDDFRARRADSGDARGGRTSCAAPGRGHGRGDEGYVPDVRVSAEPALMRRWFKDAAPVYVEGA